MNNVDFIQMPAFLLFLWGIIKTIGKGFHKNTFLILRTASIMGSLWEIVIQGSSYRLRYFLKELCLFANALSFTFFQLKKTNLRQKFCNIYYHFEFHYLLTVTLQGS